MAWSYLGFLYGRFPRKISLPEQFVVNSTEELTAAIEKYRKNTRIGCTIYTTDELPVIDRVVFDFDTKTALEDVKKLHTACRNIQHVMVFSGNGLHFYLFAQNGSGVFDRTQTLKNVYDHFKDTLGVVVDPSLYQSALTHPIACPGSLNFKPGCKRYVIFVSENDLEKGIEHLRAKAEHPPDEMIVYGNDFFDLGPYRANANATRARDRVAVPESAGAPSDMEVWIKWQPKAVNVMLTDAAKMSYKTRFYATCYLREQGYQKDAAYTILEYFWTKMPHKDGGTIWDRVLKKNVIEQVYGNDTIYSFPSERKLHVEGYL